MLILDANRWQREALATGLAYFGCLAEHTGDAGVATEMMRSRPFQLLLVYPSSPATGGREAVKQLRLLQPGVPVIVFVPEEQRMQFAWMDEGIDVIAKPTDFFALVRTISRAVSPSTETLAGRGCEDHQVNTEIRSIRREALDPVEPF